MSKRDYKIYLDDIILSSSKVLEYTKGFTFNKFTQHGQVIDAVIRNIEIIGEAVNNLPAEVKRQSKNTPWSEIVATRNKVIHEYFGVNLKIVWKTVKYEIPKLKKQAKKILTRTEKNLGSKQLKLKT